MRLLSVVIITLLLSSCYQKESSFTDSLIYCPENVPKSFEPQINDDVATRDATTQQLYNRLIKIDPIRNHFIGDLATHWQQSKDKLSYTFFLREGVHFHQTDYFTPTRLFNADDVLFSFQRRLNTSPFSNSLAAIVKIDNYTVKFILNKPDVTLLANLAAHYSVILSQQYGEKLLSEGHPEKIAIYPIGTGPYKFKNSNTFGIIRYLANSQYWNGVPRIKNLIFDTTENKTKRYSKLLSGECDIITHPAPRQLKTISRNSNIVLSSNVTNNVTLWAFNSMQKPLKQKIIRQALSYAIDRDAIVNTVFFQSATATNSLLAKHSWAYNPQFKALRYAPELALNILKDNNYDFTKSLSILTPIDNSLFNPNFRKTAEIIQKNLAAIGVHSNIILVSQIELEKRLASGDYNSYLTGININTHDPDSLLRPLLSCGYSALQGNASHWCDTTTQKLLDSALIETNFNRRVKNYYQLQTILQQERLYYPIAHLLRMDAFNKNISGLLVNPLTGIDFHKAKKVEVR